MIGSLFDELEMGQAWLGWDIVQFISFVAMGD